MHVSGEWIYCAIRFEDFFEYSEFILKKVLIAKSMPKFSKMLYKCLKKIL